MHSNDLLKQLPRFLVTLEEFMPKELIGDVSDDDNSLDLVVTCNMVSGRQIYPQDRHTQPYFTSWVTINHNNNIFIYHDRGNEKVIHIGETIYWPGTTSYNLQ